MSDQPKFIFEEKRKQPHPKNEKSLEQKKAELSMMAGIADGEENPFGKSLRNQQDQTITEINASMMQQSFLSHNEKAGGLFDEIQGSSSPLKPTQQKQQGNNFQQQTVKDQIEKEVNYKVNQIKGEISGKLEQIIKQQVEESQNMNNYLKNQENTINAKIQQINSKQVFDSRLLEEKIRQQDQFEIQLTQLESELQKTKIELNASFDSTMESNFLTLSDQIKQNSKEIGKLYQNQDDQMQKLEEKLMKKIEQIVSEANEKSLNQSQQQIQHTPSPPKKKIFDNQPQVNIHDFMNLKREFSQIQEQLQNIQQNNDKQQQQSLQQTRSTNRQIFSNSKNQNSNEKIQNTSRDQSPIKNSTANLNEIQKIKSNMQIELKQSEETQKVFIQQQLQKLRQESNDLFLKQMDLKTQDQVNFTKLNQQLQEYVQKTQSQNSEAIRVTENNFGQIQIQIQQIWSQIRQLISQNKTQQQQQFENNRAKSQSEHKDQQILTNNNQQAHFEPLKIIRQFSFGGKEILNPNINNNSLSQEIEQIEQKQEKQSQKKERENSNGSKGSRSNGSSNQKRFSSNNSENNNNNNNNIVSAKISPEHHLEKQKQISPQPSNSSLLDFSNFQQKPSHQVQQNPNQNQQHQRKRIFGSDNNNNFNNNSEINSFNSVGNLASHNSSAYPTPLDFLSSHQQSTQQLQNPSSEQSYQSSRNHSPPQQRYSMGQTNSNNNQQPVSFIDMKKQYQAEKNQNLQQGEDQIQNKQSLTPEQQQQEIEQKQQQQLISTFGSGNREKQIADQLDESQNNMDLQLEGSILDNLGNTNTLNRLSNTQYTQQSTGCFVNNFDNSDSKLDCIVREDREDRSSIVQKDLKDLLHSDLQYSPSNNQKKASNLYQQQDLIQQKNNSLKEQQLQQSSSKPPRKISGDLQMGQANLNDFTTPIKGSKGPIVDPSEQERRNKQQSQMIITTAHQAQQMGMMGKNNNNNSQEYQKTLFQPKNDNFISEQQLKEQKKMINKVEEIEEQEEEEEEKQQQQQQQDNNSNNDMDMEQKIKSNFERQLKQAQITEKYSSNIASGMSQDQSDQNIGNNNNTDNNQNQQNNNNRELTEEEMNRLSTIQEEYDELDSSLKKSQLSMINSQNNSKDASPFNNGGGDSQQTQLLFQKKEEFLEKHKKDLQNILSQQQQEELKQSQTFKESNSNNNLKSRDQSPNQYEILNVGQLDDYSYSSNNNSPQLQDKKSSKNQSAQKQQQQYNNIDFKITPEKSDQTNDNNQNELLLNRNSSAGTQNQQQYNIMEEKQKKENERNSKRSLRKTLVVGGELQRQQSLEMDRFNSAEKIQQNDPVQTLDGKRQQRAATTSQSSYNIQPQYVYNNAKSSFGSSNNIQFQQQQLNEDLDKNSSNASNYNTKTIENNSSTQYSPNNTTCDTQNQIKSYQPQQQQYSNQSYSYNNSSYQIQQQQKQQPYQQQQNQNQQIVPPIEIQQLQEQKNNENQQIQQSIGSELTNDKLSARAKTCESQGSSEMIMSNSLQKQQSFGINNNNEQQQQNNNNINEKQEKQENQTPVRPSYKLRQNDLNSSFGLGEGFYNRDSILKQQTSELGRKSAISAANDDEVVYQLDDNGYLIDDNGEYIRDDDGNMIKLTEEHIEYLRESNMLEDVQQQQTEEFTDDL